jgi:rhodanese-related sulfurtransferase
MGSDDARTDIEITPERVQAWLGEQPDLQVIDVREVHEREAGHIAGTRHVPLVELSDQAASIDHERPVVFYCRIGGRSEMAAQAFRASAYEAYTMTGGLLRWVHEGRQIEPADGHVADH